MRARFVAVLAAVTGLFIESCNNSSYPFRDPSLTVEERAADIVSRLTLDEKVAQMLNTTPAIERLGIPPYDWWNECLHGVARTEYKVTVFPQAIGMAAGWDAEAMRLMGDYTAEEARAVYNTSSAKGDYRIYHGLTFWTPNINIFRDPRWGRGQETYGEDPYLTAILGKSFVKGLQGTDSTYLKAAGCAKHYAVHSGPESSRHHYNAKVSSYDLWDTYLPAFQALVEDADVAGVMCAYNAFEGQPCCGSDKLMVDILRNDWKFTGYVTSDCGALEDFYKHHKTQPDAMHAGADALIHGTDVDCGRKAYEALKQAVETGLVKEEQMDVSLRRLFAIRIRLGMFDPAAKVPYSAIDSTALERKEHKAHALKMARQSVVLLKNNGLLPLKKDKIRKIALVGPNINLPDVQLGNYNGFPTKIITPLDAIRTALPDAEIVADTACDYVAAAKPEDISATVARVKDADVIIFVGGMSPRLEGEEQPVKLPGFEGGDRTSILLPTVQTELLKALHATGRPVVLTLMSGSAVALPWEAKSIDAIVELWYGGEFAGTALAEVLLGDYNPSGHLPVTVYAADSDLPDFEDYNMCNRTYKYFRGKPLYPFGYGLSYTKFDYSWVKKPAETCADGDNISCTFSVANTGKLAGDAVAQVYLKYPQIGNSSKTKATQKPQTVTSLPIKELRSFERCNIAPDAKSQIEVSIPVSQLAKWDEQTGGLTVPKGKYTIFVGNHSEDEAIKAEFEIK